MNKFMLRGCMLLVAASILTQCQKKAFEDKYDRPDSLQPPIYQQLESLGRFTNLLKLIDKAGYKATLEAGGYWTMFAPNDEAFKQYFTDKGIGNVDAIDSTTARAMVQYLLVYNSYKEERLDDYQATANNTGWTPSIAFRRRTAYYTGFYKDTTQYNRQIVALATNRNNKGGTSGNYVTTDDNNKYITYFTTSYFNSFNLSAADYNYFYPKSEYTGFNIGEAKVVTKDQVAENGVFHEVDKVITPLMSIDEYIRTKPEYSSFKAILNRLYTNNTISFIYNATAANRYKVLTGKSDSVFVKIYSNLLAYSPNNENFMKEEDNDGQKDCWSIFIPTNTAVDNYVKNVLCQYYATIDDLPIEVITDFLNAHMFPTVVWPSKFAVTKNNFSEPARFDPNADVVEKKILSNGFLYGTSKVEEADVFSTVYGKAYLNPKFTMMTRLLKFSGLNLLIAKSNISANVLMIPDAVFSAAGYSYNATKDQYEYKATPTSTATTNGVNDKLTRIIKTCVFFAPYKESTDNLSGSGIVKSGDAGNEGDYITFNANKIQTGGLLDAGVWANVDSSKTATNGKVYFLNQLPIYSEKGVGTHIKNLGTATTSDYNYFWQYLSNSSYYNTTTTEIVGLSGFSTIFVPTNTAIKQAVNDGLLPGTGTAPNKTPNFVPSDEAGKDLVRKFIQYHILYGHTVVPDGKTESPYNYDSFLKNAQGTALRFTVTTTPGALSIKDNYSRVANVIVAQSNNLSNRSVIHLIDNYLKYNEN
ncbi:MAG: fasciclin domain-containing protein [Chitinophagaceae bacterium]